MSDPRQDNIHRLIVPNTASLRGRGIYLLPNLFTTGALFAGFYAIIAATKGHFEGAAVAILVAIVLDGLDGRIARLTNTQSDFGAEYDSLADMVSFGVAPALLAYQWTLQEIGKFGFFCGVPLRRRRGPAAGALQRAENGAGQAFLQGAAESLGRRAGRYLHLVR